MARQYNKKSPYWEMRKNQAVTKTEASANSPKSTIPDIEYETYGENFMVSASCGGGDSSTVYRGKVTNNSITDTNRFQNLKSGILPYEVAGSRMSVSEAIDLTQRAWANFAVFRNAIEVLVEFSNSPLHIKGGNAKSREFIKQWIKKIDIRQLIEEFFREYYRSGNVFLLRFDGKLRDEDFEKMKEAMGAKRNTVPVRYIIINPTNVFVENGITSRFTYVKLLSTYEIERLKNPQTEEEKQMFNDLPEAAKKMIKAYTGGLASQIYIPIDPKRLSYAFYKKQSYEPLAIPMGYPVLDDIEWKLQLKKMDNALTRTIEHAILLITTGAEPDKGGVNPNNVRKLQEMFKNATLGRVLVADYTTKGEWLIPDFKELLGPEKYEVVDRDIREGLQTLLLGEDKFANAVIKARIFTERLQDGQEAFLNKFFNREIERVCEEMNFKSVPRAEFEKIKLEDETQYLRILTRLSELGLLTPEQTINSINTGMLPETSELETAQKSYKKQRDEGLYYPLVGGSKEKEAGRPGGSTSPQTTKSVSPIGTSGGEKFSIKAMVQNLNDFEELKKVVEGALRSHFKVLELNETQKEVVNTLSKTIFANESGKNWAELAQSYIDNPKPINEAIANKMDEVALKYDLSVEDALILVKSPINT